METFYPAVIIAALICAVGATSLVTYWLVCRPLAWHCIMYRNRKFRADFPPTWQVRPHPRDQYIVALQLLGLITCTLCLVLMAVYIDLPLYIESWQAIITLQADPQVAAGVGAVTTIVIMTVAICVAIVWHLWWYRPAVQVIRPEILQPTPPAKRPLRVID